MWTCLFILIGIISFPVESSPAIIGQLQNVTTSVGGDVTFSCQVSGKGNSQIQWWHVSGRLSIAIGLDLEYGLSDDKYHVEEMSDSNNVTTSTLTVFSADIQDEGMYRCLLRIPGLFYSAWPKTSAFMVFEAEIPQQSTKLTSVVIPTDQTRLKTADDFTSETDTEKQTGDNTASTQFPTSILTIFACILLFSFL